MQGAIQTIKKVRPIILLEIRFGPKNEFLEIIDFFKNDLDFAYKIENVSHPKIQIGLDSLSEYIYNQRKKGILHEDFLFYL